MFQKSKEKRKLRTETKAEINKNLKEMSILLAKNEYSAEDALEFASKLQTSFWVLRAKYGSGNDSKFDKDFNEVAIQQPDPYLHYALRLSNHLIQQPDVKAEQIEATRKGKDAIQKFILTFYSRVYYGIFESKKPSDVEHESFMAAINALKRDIELRG